METFYRNALLICNAYDVNAVIEAELKQYGFKFDQFMPPPSEYFQICAEKCERKVYEIADSWHFRYWGCIYQEEGEIVHEIQDDGSSFLMVMFTTDGSPVRILEYILAKYPESRLILKVDSPEHSAVYYEHSVEQEVPRVLGRDYVGCRFLELPGLEMMKSKSAKNAIEFVNRIQNMENETRCLAFEKYSD